MNRRNALCCCLLSLGLGAAAACDKTENAATAEPKKAADAGAPHASGVEKDIVDAVNQVAGGSGTPGSPANGPPPDGVFPPGAADHEIAPNALPKIAVGSKGSGPTIHFSAPKPDKKFAGKLIVGVQMGARSALPTVEFALSIEPSTPAESATSAPPARTELVARVVSAKPAAAAQQPGDLPPGMDRLIAKMKGSRIHVEVGPDGGGRITSIESSKDAEEGLGESLRAASESLALVFLPYPSDPVGVGAYWMVTSRENYGGLDVVSYRMIKLQQIDGATATLGITTKRYVAGGQLAFGGIPPHHVVGFQGTATGSIAVPAADPEAINGQSQDSLLAAALPNAAGPNGQPLQAHLEFHSALAFGPP